MVWVCLKMVVLTSHKWFALQFHHPEAGILYVAYYRQYNEANLCKIGDSYWRVNLSNNNWLVASNMFNFP